MRTLVIARLLATHYAAALTPAGPWFRPRTPHRGATSLASTPTHVTVHDHHLGGIMLGLDRVGGFLEAIAALEPKKIKSDKFQYPKSLSDPDWDGSISINTYTDYSTLYGPFTVHSYREEWDSGTDIYATDADTGKDLMGYIVQCMRASGRYRGELFGTDVDDGYREDSERLREMDEVEADYAGCLVRVGNAASTASRRVLPRRLGKFYRGNIARDHGDDTYDIVYYRYDDGGRIRETRVARSLIRLVYRRR